MINALYVNDLVLVGNDIISINRMKADLTKLFGMKDLGYAKHCLSLKISGVRSDRKYGFPKLSTPKLSSVFLSWPEVVWYQPP